MILPGAPDPQQPTLHTCNDCGAQLLIPGGLVATVVDFHRRGCLGPKLADLAERMTDLAERIEGLGSVLGDDSRPR